MMSMSIFPAFFFHFECLLKVELIINIDVGNEEIVITDTPKESLDVANIEDDLPCEDDPFESNPTKLNVVFSIVRVSQTIKLFSHIQDLFCHVLLRCLERMSDSSPVAQSEHLASSARERGYKSL